MRIGIMLTTIILFLVTICGSSQNPGITQADDRIPFAFTDSNGKSPSGWNKALYLKEPVGDLPNSLKFGSVIDLEVGNISDNQIKFPVDSNVRIYDMTNGVKELKNRVTYVPDDKGILLEPMKSKDGWVGDVIFSPVIQSEAEIKIRVFIIGEMLFDDPAKNEPVGAYMDLVLHP